MRILFVNKLFYVFSLISIALYCSSTFAQDTEDAKLAARAQCGSLFNIMTLWTGEQMIKASEMTRSELELNKYLTIHHSLGVSALANDLCRAFIEQKALTTERQIGAADAIPNVPLKAKKYRNDGKKACAALESSLDPWATSATEKNVAELIYRHCLTVLTTQVVFADPLDPYSEEK
jgi:hypothetical protein